MLKDQTKLEENKKKTFFFHFCVVANFALSFWYCHMFGLVIHLVLLIALSQLELIHPIITLFYHFQHFSPKNVADNLEKKKTSRVYQQTGVGHLSPIFSIYCMQQPICLHPAVILYLEFAENQFATTQVFLLLSSDTLRCQVAFY